MNKIEDKIEEVEEKIKELDPETDRDARKRQPWMPILGSIIAGILLIVAAMLLGWI